MGADLQGHKEEGSQPPTIIKIVFDPYDYVEVNQYLRSVSRDFGPARRGRWYFEYAAHTEENIWALRFFFSDPRDATLFGLKYSL